MVHGTVAGNDGRKMSKSYGNYTDPNELMDKYSADALRFLFVSSSLMNGEDFALLDKDVADISRKLAMVWNVYDFFTMYAEVDGWEWNDELSDHSESCENVLDIWIMSKIHTLINDVEKATEKYDLQMATRAILPFVDELSNWYVRRSRKRFWKSDDDQDKQNAYKTLHYVLVQLAHVMAPFTPFMAEELYQKLTGNRSVHLCDWPKVGHVNERVVTEMDAVRRAVNEGLALRSRNGVKIRQPLLSMTVNAETDLGPEKNEYLQILEEELNVKEVVWNMSAEESDVLDTTITEELKAEGIAREIVRAVQQARKDAGLQVDDRITLGIVAENGPVAAAATIWAEYIASQTLARGVESNDLTGDGVFSVKRSSRGSLFDSLWQSLQKSRASAGVLYKQGSTC